MYRALGRAGQYAIVLWTALTVNFLLPRLAPGDAVDYLVGEEGMLDPSSRAELARQFALDGSLAEQFGRYWARLAQGDLGWSVRYRRPVTELVLERLPWTLLLVGTALVVSLAVGLLGGAAAAVRRGRRRDVVTVTGVLALQALPSFWLGMVLVAVFAVQLGWLPSFGAGPLGGAGAGSGFTWAVEVSRRLILPVTTLVIGTGGSVFLLVRASMLATLECPYVLMAEAKGATARSITYRHALRNAVLPAYTHLTLSVGALASGAVVVETVFAYPGMGRLVYEAVAARDYALMQGAFLLITVAIVCANLLADLTYPRLDPRVRSATPTGAAG